MRILITNDDGIWAPGIRMLAEWAKTVGEVTVVAPKVEQSGMSHAIQFVEPIEIKKVDRLGADRIWFPHPRHPQCQDPGHSPSPRRDSGSI